MIQTKMPTIKETLINYGEKLKKQNAEYYRKNKRERMRDRLHKLTRDLK